MNLKFWDMDARVSPILGTRGFSNVGGEYLLKIVCLSLAASSKDRQRDPGKNELLVLVRTASRPSEFWRKQETLSAGSSLSNICLQFAFNRLWTGVLLSFLLSMILGSRRATPNTRTWRLRFRPNRCSSCTAMCSGYTSACYRK